MRKILFASLLFSLLYLPASVFGQAFTMDSLIIHVSAATDSINVLDGVNVTGPAAVTLHWHVIATDFPHDWLVTLGICDNSECYYNMPAPMIVWNDSTDAGRTFTSDPYRAGDTGIFYFVFNIDSGSPGCHYLTVTLTDSLVQTDTVTINVCKVAPAGTPMIIKSPEDVVLYPNPARDEINIVYDVASDVKNILVYNIIGKVMAAYKVTNNGSANLNLENIPQGIYFVRLLNSHGVIVATRKFIKQ